MDNVFEYGRVFSAVGSVNRGADGRRPNEPAGRCCNGGRIAGRGSLDAARRRPENFPGIRAFY